jgi:hypothetical protein
MRLLGNCLRHHRHCRRLQQAPRHIRYVIVILLCLRVCVSTFVPLNTRQLCVRTWCILLPPYQASTHAGARFPLAAHAAQPHVPVSVPPPHYPVYPYSQPVPNYGPLFGSHAASSSYGGRSGYPRESQARTRRPIHQSTRRTRTRLPRSLHILRGGGSFVLSFFFTCPHLLCVVCLFFSFSAHVSVAQSQPGHGRPDDSSSDDDDGDGDDDDNHRDDDDGGDAHADADADADTDAHRNLAGARDNVAVRVRSQGAKRPYSKLDKPVPGQAKRDASWDFMLTWQFMALVVSITCVLVIIAQLSVWWSAAHQKTDADLELERNQALAQQQQRQVQRDARVTKNAYHMPAPAGAAAPHECANRGNGQRRQGVGEVPIVNCESSVCAVSEIESNA